MRIANTLMMAARNGNPIPGKFPFKFEPARKVSEFDNNKETSSDPRVGATPLVYPLDGRVATRPVPRFIEDEYVDNIFFVAWGDGDNLKSTGGTTITPEESTLNAPWFRRVIFWPEVGTAP